MSKHIQQLIDQVVTEARAQGLSQAQLAEQAGLTAVGLSKAKGRGDLRASTLEALGRQLDLELVFVPRRSREQATRAIRSGAFFQRDEGSRED